MPRQKNCLSHFFVYYFIICLPTYPLHYKIVYILPLIPSSTISQFCVSLSKHPDDVIEVQSIRLADSGSYVAFDDEVSDVLEDKEVVSHYVMSRRRTRQSVSLEESLLPCALEIS